MNKLFKYTACAAPMCKCSSIEVVVDMDNNYQVVIADDFNGVSVVPVDEFAMLCNRFLDVWDTGCYNESN